MKATSTRIHWPCRLKIGAKTKKGKFCSVLSLRINTNKKCEFYIFLDPHVRILGKSEDVMKAKDRILAALDSRVRKTLKSLIFLHTNRLQTIYRAAVL